MIVSSEDDLGQLGSDVAIGTRISVLCQLRHHNVMMACGHLK